MKLVGGMWLPDHEAHLEDWWKNVNKSQGKLLYQTGKLEAAMKWVKNHRTAVDVGAHCGLWSAHLAEKFDCLHAFEPVADHRACFEKNVQGNVTLHPVALGEKVGACSIHTSQGSSGDSWVEGKGSIPVRTLDSFDLQDVDFIKLDCEGYELFALRGGAETLKRCKPCVIVEQKPGRAQKFGLPETGAVDYLKKLGATLRQVISGDFILSW